MDGAFFDTGHLPEEVEARIRRELRERERVVWVGLPRPGRFARQGVPLVLFGIPWTGFALFWMVGALGLFSDGGPKPFNVCFSLFGVPFVLIGLGMLSAPYWFARSAKRTCYAITDRRAIVWQPRYFGGVEVRSYGAKDLTKIRRVEYPDGSGDLVFEELMAVGTRGGHTGTTRYGFMAINSVREVENLLLRLTSSDSNSGL